MNYKSLNRILWIAIVLLAYIFIRYSFGNTFGNYGRYQELKNQSLNKEISSFNYNEFNSKKKLINSIITTFAVDSSNGNKLLGFVAEFCNEEGIVLRDFAKPEIVELNGMLVTTNQLKVSGDYFKLLTLVNQLEKERIGKIVMFKLDTELDYKRKSDVLVAYISIRNVNYSKLN